MYAHSLEAHAKLVKAKRLRGVGGVDLDGEALTPAAG